MAGAVVMADVVAAADAANDADAVVLPLPALVAKVPLPLPAYILRGSSGRGVHNNGDVHNNPCGIPCVHGDDATCHADERLHLYLKSIKIHSSLLLRISFS